MTMLCPICEGIFQGQRPPLFEPSGIKDYDGYRRQDEIDRACIRNLHSDISEVARGAISGCQICDIIWRHFFRDRSAQEYLQQPMFARNGVIHSFIGSGTHYRIRRPGTSHRNDYEPDDLELEVGLNSPMDKDIPRFKDIALTSVQGEPAVDVDVVTKPDSEVYGPHTWGIIQKWISNCRQNHSRCNLESKQTSWSPTRLLDLQYREEDDPVQRLVALMQYLMAGNLPADCKLIETATTEVEGPYMTLSHRWDSTRKPCVTNAMNIGQRKAKISAHELPPIFEEAIHVTRRMGVRYLWIDSLCIVQGEGGDWGQEAITMDRVYTHSMLNLEGTVGNSSLLQPRNPAVIAPCVVETRWTRLEPVKYVITDFRYWDARIHRSVCNTRAWICQERWLSPRILHFTFDQILWECREQEAGETFPACLPKETQSQSSTGFKQVHKRSHIENHKLSEQEKRLAEWYTVLITYGRSEVTVETDRLVAIAGVAAKFSSLLDDDWIAGLWRKNLPGDLLWYVEKTRRTNKPPPEMDAASYSLGISRTHQVQLAERLKGQRYQAPSWSWASVLGDINPGFFCPDGSDASMIDVLDVQLTSLDPKLPLGRLINGTLRLRGTLYPMAMDPPDWTEEAAMRDVRLLPPKIYLTGLGKKKKNIPGLEGSALSTYSFESHSHTCHLRADEPVAYPDLAVSCYLPIRKTVYKGTHLVAGLALKPTGRRGEYERLGRMDFGNEDCQLFEDGLEVQRKGEEGSGFRAHPPTMDPELYIEGELGTFTMV
ncbi:heterokaryon incompatibility protein-domain-containing protein [Paraphoma chrysanthemicola]|uniref:Heterokaryon incompatibility protein-domain-containing protein n=1 Tax=Paraphoma chrysanthemicola TaxID=798071 RepID=A0A8K0R7Y5_9PLEO|nr:heterokaryon incompatibility protein-domain-containing protein [Paraphoma chrysanthemicola]